MPIADNNPLVTCIIPVYNHEKFVDRAIQSVLSQTYRNIELIVIDDGSSDNSLKVCEQLREIYSFKLLHQTNQGISKTVNRGLKLAQGKYIAFCASDDIWLPNKTNLQVSYLERNKNVSLLHSNCIVYYSKKSLVTLYHRKNKFPESYSRRDFLLNNRFCPLTFMIRRDSIQRMGFLNESVPNEDFQLGWYFLSEETCSYHPEIVGIRFIHGENLTRDYSRMYRALWPTYDHIIKNNDKKFAYPYFALKAIKQLAEFNKKEAIYYFAPAMRLAHKKEFWSAMFKLLFR